MGLSSDQTFDSKISTINMIVDKVDLPPHETIMDNRNNLKSQKVANNIRKESKMHDTVDWSAISVPVALDNVVGLRENVDKQIKTRAEELSKEALDSAAEAKKQYDQMKDELEKLKSEQEKLIESSKELTIDNILGIYAQLKKPSYINAIKDEDGEAKLREKLHSRTLDSLQDALNDLKDELNSLMIEGVKDSDFQDNSASIKGTVDSGVDNNANNPTDDEEEQEESNVEDAKTKKKSGIIGLR